MPQKLSIDIETFSTRNIKKGMYAYAEHCEIILFAFAYDDEAVTAVDTWTEEIPDYVMRDLNNPEVIKYAFNAAFEIECIEQHYGITLDPWEWRCTMVKSAMCGLPLNLSDTARVMGLGAQKDKRGSELIKFFCEPCKPTKANGMRERNMPYHDAAKWKAFREYNKQDVIVEREINKGLSFYRIPKREHEYFCMDLRMAKRGVMISQELARAAMILDKQYKQPILAEANRLTGLENANSAPKLCEWLTARLGMEVLSVAKDNIPELLKVAKDATTKRVLLLRQELAKTSVTKYNAMLQGINSDGRLRGCIQYYGASRTGRAAGRLVQLHNMPKTHYKNLDRPRSKALALDIEYLELIYGAVPDVLSKLIRTAFVPKPGKVFAVSDFAAVEARITAWLAGEEWRLEAFERGDRIYSLSAAKIFNLDIRECGKGTKWDDIGKVAELAFGFGGGVGAMLNFGADKLGLSAQFMEEIKTNWRKESPKIKQLWYTFEKAAKHTIKTGEATSCMYGIRFELSGSFMFITLPSGRKLSYSNPRLEEDPDSPFGPRITYYGLHQESKKWVKLDTYGGKLTENIVQAIGRDLLYYGAKALDDAGYDIVMHVHDEVVIETEPGQVKNIENIMGINPSWAPGLPLGAEGFESLYYKK